jgi:hypothetical protein
VLKEWQFDDSSGLTQWESVNEEIDSSRWCLVTCPDLRLMVRAPQRVESGERARLSILASTCLFKCSRSGVKRREEEI